MAGTTRIPPIAWRVEGRTGGIFRLCRFSRDGSAPRGADGFVRAVSALRRRRIGFVRAILRRQVGGNAPENDGIKTAPTSPTRPRGSAGPIPARRASEGPPVRYQPDAPARVRRSDTSPTRQRGSAGRIPARRASEGPPVGYQPDAPARVGRSDTSPTRQRGSAGHRDRERARTDGPPTDPRWRVGLVFGRTADGPSLARPAGRATIVSRVSQFPPVALTVLLNNPG